MRFVLKREIHASKAATSNLRPYSSAMASTRPRRSPPIVLHPPRLHRIVLRPMPIDLVVAAHRHFEQMCAPMDDPKPMLIVGTSNVRNSDIQMAVLGFFRVPKAFGLATDSVNALRALFERAGFHGRSWWITCRHSLCRSMPSCPTVVTTRTSGTSGVLNPVKNRSRSLPGTPPVTRATMSRFRVASSYAVICCSSPTAFFRLSRYASKRCRADSPATGGVL